MNAYCPRDQHLRILDRNTGQLMCQATNCQCDQCHLRLSPEERREWTGDK